MDVRAAQEDPTWAYEGHKQEAARQSAEATQAHSWLDLWDRNPPSVGPACTRQPTLAC